MGRNVVSISEGHKGQAMRYRMATVGTALVAAAAIVMTMFGLLEGPAPQTVNPDTQMAPWRVVNILRVLNAPDLVLQFAWLVTASVVLLAAASALLMTVRTRDNSNAILLSGALALAAVATSYVGYWRPSLLFPSVVVDLAAAATISFAASFWVRYFSVYPVVVDEVNLVRAIGGSSVLRKFGQQDAVSRLWFVQWVQKLNDTLSLFEFRGGQLFTSTGFAIAAGAVLGSLLLLSRATVATAIIETAEFAAFGGLFTLAFIYSFQRLKTNYVYGDEEARRKIAWIFICLPPLGAIFIALFLSFILLGVMGHTELGMQLFAVLTVIFPPVAALIVLVAVMMSVFYRGTLDPRLVMTKTTLYSFVGLLTTMIFVAIEGAVSSQVVLRLGLPSQSGAILAGTASALIFGPVRNRVELAIEKRVEAILPLSAILEGEKRLSAVAFNDLSGFTQLSDRDEVEALRMAATFHKEGLRVASRWKGRVVKTIGDAVMLEFPTSDAAVEAIIELHASFKKACAIHNAESLPVHTGIHFGEVTRARSGDIFGRTVNLAARLEDVAAGNEVIISETTFVRLTGSWEFEDIGVRKLKNVNNEVRCYRYRT